jgi:hypothetical protein
MPYKNLLYSSLTPSLFIEVPELSQEEPKHVDHWNEIAHNILEIRNVLFNIQFYMTIILRQEEHSLCP